MDAATMAGGMRFRDAAKRRLTGFSERDRAGKTSSARSGRGRSAQDGFACPRSSSIPLAFVPAGGMAVVVSVRGDEEMRRHLENLGFVDGAGVVVASEMAGSLIVEVKGSRVALDRKTAMKISVGAA